VHLRQRLSTPILQTATRGGRSRGAVRGHLLGGPLSAEGRHRLGKGGRTAAAAATDTVTLRQGATAAAAAACATGLPVAWLARSACRGCAVAPRALRPPLHKRRNFGLVICTS